MIADLGMAEKYAVLNENAYTLARAFWPGSLTLILKKMPDIKTGISRDLETFGARVSDHPFCLALAEAFGKPYTGTSANRSGEESKRSIPEILAQLGEAVRYIDLVIDAGELPSSLPSTVVDAHVPRPVILREGAISAGEIWEVLRTEP